VGLKKTLFPFLNLREQAIFVDKTGLLTLKVNNLGF
jgi:hypothetical protein